MVEATGCRQPAQGADTRWPPSSEALSPILDPSSGLDVDLAEVLSKARHISSDSSVLLAEPRKKLPSNPSLPCHYCDTTFANVLRHACFRQPWATLIHTNGEKWHSWARCKPLRSVDEVHGLQHQALRPAGASRQRGWNAAFLGPSPVFVDFT